MRGSVLFFFGLSVFEEIAFLATIIILFAPCAMRDNSSLMFFLIFAHTSHFFILKTLQSSYTIEGSEKFEMHILNRFHTSSCFIKPAVNQRRALCYHFGRGFRGIRQLLTCKSIATAGGFPGMVAKNTPQVPKLCAPRLRTVADRSATFSPWRPR